jgi:hypothetical protein
MWVLDSARMAELCSLFAELETMHWRRDSMSVAIS